MSKVPNAACKMPKRIKRHGMPSALDTAPFGTECIIKKDDDFTIYLQMSPNEEKPNWQLVGTFPHNASPNSVTEKIIHIKQLKL